MAYLKQFLIITIFLFFNIANAQNYISNKISEYRYGQSIKEVNEELEKNTSLKLCSGVKLVRTCGNKICDKNETIKNCAADCLKDEIRSYNHQYICTGIKTIFTPKNITEVKEAVQKANEYGMKVRAAGNLHSANTQLCTQGVTVSTKNLKQIIGLETFNGEEVVNVEAGVTLGELSEWLHEKDRSLGYTLIGYRGVTVAGSTATGSHGSSPKHDAVLSSLNARKRRIAVN